MIKLYVAGPMTGLPDLNYPKFLEAEEKLHKAGFSTVSPHRIDQLIPIPCGHAVYRGEIRYADPVEGCEDCASRTWKWYMRQALRMLLDCDGVALLPGYQRSRGAQGEVRTASLLQMPYHYVDIWINHRDEMEKRWGH